MYGWESGLESTDLYCNATERENASCYISGGTDSSDPTNPRQSGSLSLSHRKRYTCWIIGSGNA